MDPGIIKILMVGDERCGKTSFLSRLRAGENVNPIPLLRDIDQPFKFNVNLGGQSRILEFYDTSSPDNWRLLDPDVVILCYDISQRLSLINMKRYVSCIVYKSATSSHPPANYACCQWINEVKGAFSRVDSLPIIVLGLKRDLRSEDDPNGIIYPQEAYQMAQELRADRYVECSARSGELLKAAFEDICKTATATITAAGGQSEGGCTLM
ncbi:Putative Small GTPase superfamily [[Torrubiella] hemipterigena]|uniref:Putative Small GTPase superfamily n=1 Tax=[Torrubiella] hemipterigena TaxID=1531966 RepID=A0A0A1T3G1_9HYPO|nr:Putative Small GTPase superfamily [[Torrubiella] hemipterigena]